MGLSGDGPHGGRDAVADTLRHRTHKAFFWTLIEAVGLRGIQFAISILLARLLAPEQFGLIGLLAIFMAIPQLFLDSGFGSALIQKKNASEADICSIFYFNIGIGAVTAGLLCLAAPWIAAFYEEPLLTPMARALSLAIVIGSFSLIQSTLLTKQLDFKRQTQVSLIASLVSGIIGVCMALSGFGVWSLVAQQICSTTLTTGLLWIFSPWRPARVFSGRSLKEMFGFSSRVLAVGLINAVIQNLHPMVIGKLFSTVSLGFYTRAKTIAELPSHTLSGIVKRVTFPLFSTIQDDPVRLKRATREALAKLVAVIFPMTLGLAAVAKPLVLVLLTDKWAPCIPYLRLLCIVGLLYPFHIVNLNILMVKGRSDLYCRIEAIKPLLVGLSIAVSYRWGISAMIVGYIVVAVICYYINSYYACRLLNYPLKEQLSDAAPYLGVTLLMAVGTWAVQWLPFHSNSLLLACQIGVGAFLYVVLSHVFKAAALLETLVTVKDAVRNSLLSSGLTRTGNEA
jgi:teichuronic acid exporter